MQLTLVAIQNRNRICRQKKLSNNLSVSEHGLWDKTPYDTFKDSRRVANQRCYLDLPL